MEGLAMIYFISRINNLSLYRVLVPNIKVNLRYISFSLLTAYINCDSEVSFTYVMSIIGGGYFINHRFQALR